MIIEYTYNGIVVSDIIDNRRVWQRYIGIPLKQCKKLFKAYIKTL